MVPRVSVCAARVTQKRVGDLVELRVSSGQWPLNCSSTPARATDVYVARLQGNLTTLQLLSRFELDTEDHIFHISRETSDEAEYRVHVHRWWVLVDDNYLENGWNMPMQGPAHGLGEGAVCDAAREVRGSPLTLHMPTNRPLVTMLVDPADDNSNYRPSRIGPSQWHLARFGHVPVGRWVSASGCQLLGVCDVPSDESAFTWVYFGSHALSCTGPSERATAEARLATMRFTQHRRLLVVGDSRECMPALFVPTRFSSMQRCGGREGLMPGRFRW